MQIKLEKEFKGHNLTIRTATENDAKILADWWNDGRVMKFEGFPLGINTCEETIKNQIFPILSQDKHSFIIEYDNKRIGNMGYKIKDDNSANFLIRICELDYHERGLGTELLKMLFNYLFYQKNVDKITCSTNLSNCRAQYVYEKKLNMKNTKILYDCWENQVGEICSMVFYEITKKKIP